MHVFRTAAFALAAAAAASAQVTAPPTTPITGKVEFEVASIRPSQPLDGTNISNIGLHIDGGMARISSLSLRDEIRIAFKVKDFQIIGPDWLLSTRFDISGKIPSGASTDQVPEMLQALFAQRFHMAAHHELRDMPVMALVAAKSGAKLKASPPDEFSANGAPRAAVDVSVSLGSGRNPTISLGAGSSYSMLEDKLEGKKLDMTRLADILARFVDRPVIDQTKIDGFYDLSLTMPQDEFTMLKIRSAVAAGISLPPQATAMLEHAPDPVGTLDRALQTVGLRLETRKLPYDVVVIDSFDKTPTDN